MGEIAIGFRKSNQEKWHLCKYKDVTSCDSADCGGEHDPISITGDVLCPKDTRPVAALFTSNATMSSS